MKKKTPAIVPPARMITLKIPADTNATLDALGVVYGLSKTRLAELAVETARAVWTTHGKIEISAATKAV